MRNIYELEKRWLNYKIKKYLPHTGAIITAILLLIYVFNTIQIPKTQKEKDVEKKEKIEHVALKKAEPENLEDTTKPSVQTEIQNKTKNQDEKIVLTPSLDFMKNLQINSMVSNNLKTKEPNTLETSNLSTNEKKTNSQKEIYKIQQIQEENIKNTNIDDNQKSPSFSLVRQETIDDINHVIERFKKNNDPALSLFIAKKYYKLKNYPKAYNYALVTNGINKNIDESWIIFSKSLVKLGEKNKAIQTLTKYIEQSNSTNAKILLNDIKSGKFK